MFPYERQVYGSTPLGGQAAVPRRVALQGRRGVFGEGRVICVFVCVCLVGGSLPVGSWKDS